MPGKRQASRSVLREQLAYHPAMDVGQAALDAVVVERQAGVVDAEQVQYRGVEIMNAGRVLGDLPADVIARSVCNAMFETGARQPDAENIRVVIAARSHLAVSAF